MTKEISLSKKDLIYYLKSINEQEIQDLFKRANLLSEKLFQNKIHFRGIIEFSNICEKNCYYCGLRKDLKIPRYIMSKDEILQMARFCFEMGYGSIVLQSGEVLSPKREDFLIDLVSSIKEKYDLGITLSLGEVSKTILKKLFYAGAQRYLLRIETSNKEHYQKLHPKDHSFENRIKTLQTLKDIGYQVGTGVMIGLPFQTFDDLAQDILFYKKFDIDMIGMGPYVAHEKTPLFKHNSLLKDPFMLSLKMIALSRLFLKDVNIAATSALQAFDKTGREKALLCGANILMPIVTPKHLRKNYLIYPSKPCQEDTKEKCFACLTNRLKSINKKIAKNEFGNSIHFLKRQKNDR
jgi:biotin synthase